MLDFFRKQKTKIVIIAVIIITIFVIFGVKSIFKKSDTVSETKSHTSTNSTDFDFYNPNNNNNAENIPQFVVDPTLPTEGGHDLGNTQS